MDAMDPVFRPAYSKIFNALTQRGLPVGSSATKKRSVRGKTLLKIRREVATSIKEVAAQKSIRLREDAEVFLFLALYGTVLLPAEVAKQQVRLDTWRANLRGDLGIILDEAMASGTDNGEVTASSVVHATSRKYDQLALSKGWIG